MTDFKTCKKCNQHKPFTEFYRDRSKKDGYRNECRTCKRAEQNAEWYEKNRDTVLRQQAQYRAANPEAVRERRARHYRESPNIYRRSRQARRARNARAFVEHVSYDVLGERDGDNYFVCHSPH